MVYTVHPGLFFVLFSSPEHEVLKMSYCGQSISVVPHAVSTICFNAYSSYTPGSFDWKLGRGD